jgi:hypothetical protein
MDRQEFAGRQSHMPRVCPEEALDSKTLKARLLIRFPDHGIMRLLAVLDRAGGYLNPCLRSGRLRED